MILYNSGGQPIGEIWEEHTKPKDMKISQKGLDMIKHFESFRSEPYLCSAGVPTIGYGTTYYKGGVKVTLQDDAIDKNEATDLLRTQVDKIYGKAVNDNLTVEVTQNQWDALVSFTYNLGGSNFKRSTLLKRVNEGKNNKAGDEFLRWDKAGGKVLAGLTRRRKAERKLYLS